MKKNKKIGLVSCYWVHNYGSSLQSFALQNVVEKLGYEVENINYINNSSKFNKLLSFLKKLRYKNVRTSKLKQIKKTFIKFTNKSFSENLKIRDEMFDSFINDNIKISKGYYGFEELKQCCDGFDTFIVGSDQLWLPDNIERDYYTMNWVRDDIKKISYSTSFGVSDLPKNLKNKAKKFINRIDHLSVREISGQQLIRKITNREAKVVLDPTLLLAEKDWNNIIPNDSLIEEKYIFCYFLADGDIKREYANYLREKYNLKIVTLKHLDEYIKSDENFGDYSFYNVDPGMFLKLIKNAEYICTDSFHGTVFSIIFNKQFFVFNRFITNTVGSTNTRLDSLLTLFDLKIRRLNSLDETLDENNIDYKDVNYKLEMLKKESLDYLKNSLK